jgi:hypothetical protein
VETGNRRSEADIPDFFAKPGITGKLGDPLWLCIGRGLAGAGGEKDRSGGKESEAHGISFFGLLPAENVETRANIPFPSDAPGRRN